MRATLAAACKASQAREAENWRAAYTAGSCSTETPSTSSEWTDLHLAVLARDADKVQQLLQQGAAPDAGQKPTPLMLACIGTPTSLDELDKCNDGYRVCIDVIARLPGRASHIIVKQLLCAGACALAEWKQASPLVLAIANGDLPTVQEVLTVCAVGHCSVAFSPLATAIRLGQATILAELLQSGADPNDCRYRGGERYPLHIASELKDVQCCKLLLEHGADPNAADHDNRRALHHAVTNGDRPAEMSADEQVSFATFRSDSLVTLLRAHVALYGPCFHVVTHKVAALATIPKPSLIMLSLRLTSCTRVLT